MERGPVCYRAAAPAEQLVIRPSRRPSPVDSRGDAGIARAFCVYREPQRRSVQSRFVVEPADLDETWMPFDRIGNSSARLRQIGEPTFQTHVTSALGQFLKASRTGAICIDNTHSIHQM